MASTILLSVGESKFRVLRWVYTPATRKLWTSTLRMRATFEGRSQKKQEKKPNTNNGTLQDNEQDNDSIYYPSFSSVSQLFGGGMVINKSSSDFDEHDERLNAAEDIWKSSMRDGCSELMGGLFPSLLFHVPGQNTEDVMRMSKDYAASLQRHTSLSTSTINRHQKTFQRVFPLTRQGQGRDGSTRSFSTTCPRLATSSTPYQLLGVSPTASAADIKSQFYTIAKKLHPDKLDPNLTKKEQEQYLEKFRLVVKAYELLKNPRQREMYDKYCIGWEGTPDVPPRMHWSSPSQFRPTTQAEWEQWYMWSEMLRRRGPSWQHMAQNRSTSDHFYGHTKVTPEDAKRQREAAPLNHRIFFVLFFLGSIIATIQIDGAKQYSARDSSVAAQHTSMVARNLEQARMHARSEEGLLRQRLMLERAREIKKAKEHDQVPMLTS